MISPFFDSSIGNDLPSLFQIKTRYSKWPSWPMDSKFYTFSSLLTVKSYQRSKLASSKEEKKRVFSLFFFRKKKLIQSSQTWCHFLFGYNKLLCYFQFKEQFIIEISCHLASKIWYSSYFSFLLKYL